MYTKETCIEIITEYVTMRKDNFGYCWALGNIMLNGQEWWIDEAHIEGNDVMFTLKDRDLLRDKIYRRASELNFDVLNKIVANNHEKMLENFEKENLPDTTYDECHAQEPIKVEGLYAFDDEGNKIAPWRVYFGIDFWQNACVGGNAYYHYLNALRPVYLPDGTRYRLPNLRNVQARYKDGVLCEFERG